MVGRKGGPPEGLNLLAHVTEMVTISDREGAIVYANPATERVSGYAPEEFMALDPFERMHPEDRPRCEAAFEELANTPGLSISLEHRVRHKDGTWRWVEGTFSSLFDDPEVGGLLATVRDITERKRAEAARHESEERQAFLLELSDAVRSLGDPEAIQGAASRLLGEHLGVDRAAYGELEPGDELMSVARDWTSPGTPSVVGVYRIDDFGRFFTDPLREGRTSVIEDAANDPRVSRPTYDNTWGSIGVRSAIAYPLVKRGRFVAAIFVHGRDARAWSEGEVSLVAEVGERTWEAIERHRTEAALGESEEKYRTLFESIDEGFCIVEVIFDETGEPVDYRFLEVNPAFERHTGLHAAAGRRMRELEPRHEEHWFETYGRIARTGEPERFQNTAEYLDRRHFDVYAFRIGAAEERKVAILFTDITRRREVEEERLRLRGLEASVRSEAEERHRIGRELHDRVAHTMGVAHQNLQLYAAYAKSDPTRGADKLKRATEATKTALEQTRDLSAQLARQGTEETHEGLGAALRELLDSYVPEGVKTALSVEGEESAVPQHVADEAYLVMREAVRNAVEHSGCGRIEVSIEIRGGGLWGRVQDDGKGFDPSDDPDYMLSGQGNGGPDEGVGLGSMRKRAELLGGRLSLDSGSGSGTAVEVWLPLAD